MMSRATSGLRREIHEAGVGEAAPLGPVADRAQSMAIIAATNGRWSPNATASRM